MSDDLDRDVADGERFERALVWEKTEKLGAVGDLA